MSFKFIIPLFGLALVASGASVERPELTGSWRLEPSLSEIHTRIAPQLMWQIEQTGNAIHLVQRTPERKDVDEIRCNTDGKDCRVKEEGHKATVSFYYNGAVLVELETDGQENVTKKRMHVSSDGATLTVDVIHITPAGKPQEKLVLSKQLAQ